MSQEVIRLLVRQGPHPGFVDLALTVQLVNVVARPGESRARNTPGTFGEVGLAGREVFHGELSLARHIRWQALHRTRDLMKIQSGYFTRPSKTSVAFAEERA